VFTKVFCAALARLALIGIASMEIDDVETFMSIVRLTILIVAIIAQHTKLDVTVNEVSVETCFLINKSNNPSAFKVWVPSS
jgi:hypothetical protein